MHTHFEIFIFMKNKYPVERLVLKNGKVIYREIFTNPSDWRMAGGNTILDMFEDRFLFKPKECRYISQYGCNIRKNREGLRRIITKLLDFKVKFFNVMFKTSRTQVPDL